MGYRSAREVNPGLPPCGRRMPARVSHPPGLSCSCKQNTGRRPGIGKYLLHIKDHVWVDSDVFDWLASESLTFHAWFRRGEPGPTPICISLPIQYYWHGAQGSICLRQGDAREEGSDAMPM